MAYPKVIDNRRRSLLSVLSELSPKFDELSVATGYWDLNGMSDLLPYIQEYKKIRILIGQEPLRARFQHILSTETNEDFPEADIKWDLNKLDYEANFVEAGVAITDLITAGILEVKIYRGAFLHAKSYIFSDSVGSDAVGIIGSSNFTHAGLTTNTELNSLEDESRIVKYKPERVDDTHGHMSWFNEMWSDPLSEKWNGKFSQIIQESPLGKTCFSPYEMYMKTLWELYKDEVEISTQISDATSSSLFAFQQRNARLLIQKLQKYGVAMLADSVGLGKTITAGAVIKEFIESYKARRIYIIVPATLVQPWKRDLAKIHGMVSGFEIISMQNFQEIERAREIDKYADVDLFVIDEAHNLRNPNGTRHEQLLGWFSNNPSSHVLLLTATPINNKLTDFVNQIQLAAKGRLSSFPVVYPTARKREIIDFFEAVKRLTSDMQASENKGEAVDFKRVSRVMRQGLRHFLVRTTRKGIEAEFGGLLSEDGTLKSFPKSNVLNQPYSFSKELNGKILSTLNLNSGVFEGINPAALEIDLLLNQTQRTKHPLDLLDTNMKPVSQEDMPGAFENIFKLILLLGFPPYKTSIYQNQFYGKTNEQLANFDLPTEVSFKLRSQMGIHNIMRVTFLKRLESSQAALAKSIDQYIERVTKFEEFLNQGHLTSIKDINAITREFGEDFENWDSEMVRKELEIEVVPADINKFNLPQLKIDIKRDLEIARVIQECCMVLNENDDKLLSLVALIKDLQKNNVAGEKILLFSYFTDTIKYLQDRLPKLIQDKDFINRAAFLTGSSKSELEDIVHRFSPISTNAEINEEDRIDYLFSTDVLSEGQNLQDCGTLINYDLHWNPVRMIQRNGRINRLGSVYENVYIYNLHPDTSLDSYLRLVHRLEHKIDAIRFTIGTDQSVLGEEANPIEFLDGIEESESLKTVIEMYATQGSTDIFEQFDDDQELLSEDEFVIELRRFLASSDQEQIDKVTKIPTGKWGYLPSSTKLPSGHALALTNTFGVIEGTGENFNSHIFIEVDPESGFMLDAVDMIEALQNLKTDSTDALKAIDKIGLDRKKIKKFVIARSREESRSSTSAVRKTPTKVRILNYLFNSLPGLEIALALNNVTTNTQLRKVDSLFLTANRELKSHGQLLPSTLEAFITLTKELKDLRAESKQVEDVEAVLFYVAN